MHKFTIDFIGLLNAQEISIVELAKKANVDRSRVNRITTADEPHYSRLKVGQMLHALGVHPYPPLLLELTDEGRQLSVDWDGLLAANDLYRTEGAYEGLPDYADLVRRTKLRQHQIRHVILYDPVEYARVTLGTMLYALNVSLYPPFFYETEDGTTRGPYEPETNYYRAGKRGPVPRK